jgi:hypothetical protein
MVAAAAVVLRAGPRVLEVLEVEVLEVAAQVP